MQRLHMPFLLRPQKARYVLHDILPCLWSWLCLAGWCPAFASTSAAWPLAGMRRVVELCPMGLEKHGQKSLYTPLGSCCEAGMGNARDGDNKGH